MRRVPGHVDLQHGRRYRMRCWLRIWRRRLYGVSFGPGKGRNEQQWMRELCTGDVRRGHGERCLYRVRDGHVHQPSRCDVECGVYGVPCRHVLDDDGCVVERGMHDVQRGDVRGGDRIDGVHELPGGRVLQHHRRDELRSGVRLQ